jgi:hypothetical protein
MLKTRGRCDESGDSLIAALDRKADILTGTTTTTR